MTKKIFREMKNKWKCNRGSYVPELVLSFMIDDLIDTLERFMKMIE